MMEPLLLIGFPGPTELIIIFVIILVLFGGAKLPEMARNIGKGMRVFKEEATTLKKELEVADQPVSTTQSKMSSGVAKGQETSKETSKDAANSDSSAGNDSPKQAEPVTDVTGESVSDAKETPEAKQA